MNVRVLTILSQFSRAFFEETARVLVVVMGASSISLLDAHSDAFVVFCFLVGGGSVVSSSVALAGLFLVAGGFLPVEGLPGAFLLEAALVVFEVAAGFLAVFGTVSIGRSGLGA